MRRTTLAFLAAGAVLLAACAGSAAPADANTITVEAKDFQFTPGTIEVTAGQPVTLIFNNAGTLEHDFTIMDISLTMIATAMPVEGHEMGDMEHGHAPELHLAAMPGKKNSIAFTPTEPGTYEIQCTVAGHKEAGMHGTLVVKAP